MSITRVAWVGGANLDIHVLAGQATRTLHHDLLIFDTGSTSGVLATSYLALHPTVTLAFNALFKGAPAAGGITLNPTTGQVTVDAALPALHKNNFIIEVVVKDSSDNSQVTETIRIHIHQLVTTLQLTPPELTIRPSADPLTADDQTGYRFTVRATFDDGSMGDLTTGHDVQWSPGNQVTTDGNIIIQTTNAVGSSFAITATLLPVWGGSSAQATVHVGAAWANESAMPKASIVPGGGWPGITVPDQAPNILILGDGFTAVDQSAFETIATTLVHFIKTNEVARPFDLLCTAMNFWRAWFPSQTRGIAFRCEVYSIDHHVWPMPRAVKPPATGRWNLSHLIYAVGLPVAADMSKSVSDLRTEWGLLTTIPPTVHQANHDLIAYWKKLGNRGFIDEIETFPGMSYGNPPAANDDSDTPMLDLHDGRIGRAGLHRFFSALASDSNVQVAGNPIGTVWADRGTYPFDNTDLILIISAYPGGRGANYQGYIAMTTVSGISPIPAKPVAGGSNFTLNFTTAPKDVSADTAHTATHELGHSFGLGDEYVDFESAFPFSTSDVADSANLQRLADVQKTSQIDGSLIRWNWLRARKAAVVSGAPANGPDPISFVIPVVSGQGSQFAPNDIVRLRLRKPGTLIDYANKVTELVSDLEVVSATADSVTVTAAIWAGPVALADLQAFPTGSTLYAPVPMPASLRDAANPYASLVAKNVENLITTKHAPLYVRPTGSALSEAEKTDQTEQQPKLDGLPVFPGTPSVSKRSQAS